MGDGPLKSSDKVITLPNRYSPMGQAQGGLLFFRPCKAIAAHMQQLTLSNPMLQYPFHSAEQTFLDWCATAPSVHWLLQDTL